MNNFNDLEQKKTLQAAFKLLSIRQMTVCNLKKKLEEKGFPPDEIGETINKLVEWKYLDDRSYAIAYVKIRKEKLSRKLIRLKLFNEGIDKEIANSVLEEFYSDKNEYDNCLRTAGKLWGEEFLKWEKKYKQNPKYKNISPEILLKKKVGDKLLLKGFSINIVKSTLEIVSERDSF